MSKRPKNYYQLTIYSSLNDFTGIRPGEWYVHRAPILYYHVVYYVHVRTLNRHRKCDRFGGRFIGPALNRPYFRHSEVPPYSVVDAVSNAKVQYDGLADTWLTLRLTR